MAANVERKRMKVLVQTKDLSRQEWLKYRTLGIGGSDVSVIAGVNKFRSIFQLWLEKTRQVEVTESENDYTHFGNVLEPVVKKEFMKRTGLTVRAKRAILQSEEYPFMLADLDGVIYENGEMVIYEAKTASAYKQEVWERGVPMEYILQVQHYMAVTGAKKAYVAALVGGNHFYYHTLHRDDDLIDWIISMEKEFWENCVLGMQEPVADGSEATSAFLNERYESSNGKVIELPEKALELCESYDTLTAQLKKLKEEKDAVTNQLKMYLQDNEVGKVGDRTVMWKSVKTTTFDKNRFASDNKALYDEYCVASQYRRLSVA